MNDFITIMTFTYPSEVYIIKGRLESEGIDCFVKDELTTQINPFYSNAIGGIKLQVRENDIKRSLEILKEVGFKIESDLLRPKYWQKIDNITSKIPFFNRLVIEFRVVIILSLIILGIFTFFYFLSLPKPVSLKQKLTQGIWCINSVYFNSKPVPVNTIHTISIAGVCPETLQFQESGNIILPSVNSQSIWGKWKLKDNKLSIYNLDTLDTIFGGEFELNFYGGGLDIQSTKTTIYTHI